MSNLIQFGNYKGRTLEWLFFNKPGDAKRVAEEQLNGNLYLITEEQTDHFKELYNRARWLAGTCDVCRERPVIRMGLNVPHRSNTLAGVLFLCTSCDYPIGRIPEYCTPSFFVETHTISKKDMKVINNAIRRHYIGSGGNLTQKIMEKFFHNDANFREPTLGFFSTPATTLKAA